MTAFYCDLAPALSQDMQLKSLRQTCRLMRLNHNTAINKNPLSNLQFTNFLWIWLEFLLFWFDTECVDFPWTTVSLMSSFYKAVELGMWKRMQQTTNFLFEV